MRGVLLLHHGAVGDLIVSLPAIAAVREHFGGPLDALGHTERLQLIASGRGPVDNILCIDPLLWSRLNTCLHPVPEAWDRYQCVLAFTASRHLRANLAHALGPRAIVLPPPGAVRSKHVIDGLTDRLPQSVRVRVKRYPELCPTSSDLSAAARLARTDGSLIIHPGSGSRAKCWPAERFARVAAELADRLKLQVTVVIGPAEADRPDVLNAVRSAFAPLGAASIGPLPLTELAAVLAKAQLYLGNDSGPSHIAAALDRASVVIFGPSDPDIWAPRSRSGRLAVVAAPDGKLQNLSTDVVVEAALSLFNRSEGT